VSALNLSRSEAKGTIFISEAYSIALARGGKGLRFMFDSVWM